MTKEFILAGGEHVTVRKSTRAKRIILRIDHTGKVIVTIPRLAPYHAGVKFAAMQQKWITDNAITYTTNLIHPKDSIGKEHHITFKQTASDHIKSHVRQNIITISHPMQLPYSTEEVQKEAQRAATRAIKKEADTYLPRTIFKLAVNHGYRYTHIRVKNMRTRWGSCSSEKVINLSIWLMQLPDELIEYVCFHELTHLNHPHHQVAFWAELAEMVPDWKIRREKLKEYRPSLMIEGKL